MAGRRTPSRWTRTAKRSTSFRLGNAPTSRRCRRRWRLISGASRGLTPETLACATPAHSKLQTVRLIVVPGSEKTQIARPTTSMTSDQVNLGFTFVDLGSPTVGDSTPVALHCDAGTDALNGVSVDLFAGTCASPMSGGLILELTPFVVHSISGHSYGTIFQ